MVVRSQRPVRHHRRRDRGAAAVEFALVSPILLGMLFGVIDYGLYFADVLTMQQGVGNAARGATMAQLDASGVPRWGAASCSTTPVVLDPAGTSQLSALACSAAGSVQPLTGVVYAKAELIDATTGKATAAWKAGDRIRVCTLTDHPPVLPFVPLPSGGMIRTRVDMPVQAVTLSLLMNPVATGLPAPPADWSWC